jgi:hypothetical protein
VFVKVWFPPYDEDTRGNRLVRSQIRKTEDGRERRIYLCCCDTVARQVEQVLQPGGFTRLEMPDNLKRTYSHRYGVAGQLAGPVRGFLELLEEVLVLEVSASLECAIALDFYKDPDPDLDPRQWPNTAAGQLVNAGKYWGNESARQKLVEALADVIDRHPIYARADVILTVPGHRARTTSFGERVAKGVADTVNIPLLRTGAVNAERTSAKEADDQGWPRDLSGEFIVGPEVHGKVVIVIDDVFHTGITMSAVAKAARDAGAVAVLGLVGARTLRR